MKKTRWPGNWKVQCHVCGFQYPSSEIRKRWDGLLVCDKDFETRHPQTLIKIRAEHAVPEFVSKDVNPDVFVHFCDIFSSSGYADMGTADCARADSLGSMSYESLLDLTTNGHEARSFALSTPPAPEETFYRITSSGDIRITSSSDTRIYS